MKSKIIYSITLFISLTFLFSCKPENKKEDNDAEVSVTDSITAPKENPYINAEMEIKVFKNDSGAGANLKGFGYDVYLNQKLYIHQPNIPAVSGNTGFNTEEEARKAGELIAYKIKHNIMPPSVTAKELDSLGVLK